MTGVNRAVLNTATIITRTVWVSSSDKAHK